MSKIAMLYTIVTLWQKGESERSIAKSLGCSRDKIRSVIKQYKAQGFAIQPKPGKSLIDGYKSKVIEYLEKGLSSVRIHEELTILGAKVSYSTVSHYVQKVKGNEKVCVRFHTEAGEEAQIDFGYVGLQYDIEGKQRKAWVFNMRLSYSRLDYYEVVFNQTVRTFIMAHIHAFRCFKGVPRVLKIDNLKAAILKANFYEDTYQVLYKKFSEYYGCNILPCRVAQPKEKGKVEAGVKFIKNNFFAGRKFNNYQELTTSLKGWLNRKNKRLHGTTKKIPEEIFNQEEKAKLIKLPLIDFIVPEIIRRKVYHDCHVVFEHNYYSVPYEYVGKIVDLQQDDKLLHINYNNKQIAVHSKNYGKGEFITNLSHYPKYKHFTPESPAYRALYSEKMKAIGSCALEMFNLILIEQPYHWYKTTKGILSLQKTYANQIIEDACKRALNFRITSYSKIKNICSSGSYNLPLETYKEDIDE